MPRHWWVRHTDNTYRAPYLIALLLAASHKKPVPHFATDQEYAAIIEGKDYVKKQRCKKAAFEFLADECLEGVVSDEHQDESAEPSGGGGRRPSATASAHRGRLAPTVALATPPRPRSFAQPRPDPPSSRPAAP